MPSVRPLILLALLASLAACNCPCAVKENPLPLPAPITLQEQARRLTAWSHALPRIQAQTVLAGVRLDYRDDQGQDRTVNAEGLLQIRQHPESAAPVTAEVLLRGTSFDQPAFEAGRNAKDWWFAIKADTKKAWMGDATQPVNFANLGREGSAGILRADLVPDLLGLSDLPPQFFTTAPDAPLPPAFLLMLADDAEGTNHLLITQQHALSRDSKGVTTQATVIQREIIVDRRSGTIREVRLYDPAGIVAVRSQLTAYAPVTYAEGLAKPLTADIPQFPRKVVVTYPSQHLTVSLQFDEVQIVPDFRPTVFRTPDFQTQGLRIIPAE